MNERTACPQVLALKSSPMTGCAPLIPALWAGSFTSVAMGRSLQHGQPTK
jgi:hypothetical protein